MIANRDHLGTVQNAWFVIRVSPVRDFFIFEITFRAIHKGIYYR